MDIGSILLILALAVFVCAFVYQPFRVRQSAPLSQYESSLSPLLAERERILDALVELDFDHELGKVPENIYGLQRNRLLQMGADVLRRIDELQSEASLEVDDPLEAMIAARRKSRKSTGKGQICHACGEKVKAGDRFCANCGADLS
ncbi:MAG: zinc ribbon domain-containing protein [Anaerolineales bacterium]|jgi:hypothetical protein